MPERWEGQRGLRPRCREWRDAAMARSVAALVGVDSGRLVANGTFAVVCWA